MKRIGRNCVLLAALAFGAAGCSATSYYLGNRVNDLADVVQVELTFGLGAEAHIKLTNLFNLAWGFSTTRGFVMDGRMIGVGERSTSALMPFPGTTRLVYTDVSPVWSPPAPPGAGESEAPTWTGPARHRSSWAQTLDVALGASLLVGVHLGVSPLEAVDFVFGFAGLDLAGDDAARPPPPKSPEPTKPAPPKSNG